MIEIKELNFSSTHSIISNFILIYAVEAEMKLHVIYFLTFPDI